MARERSHSQDAEPINWAIALQLHLGCTCLSPGKIIHEPTCPLADNRDTDQDGNGKQLLMDGAPALVITLTAWYGSVAVLHGRDARGRERLLDELEVKSPEISGLGSERLRAGGLNYDRIARDAPLLNDPASVTALRGGIVPAVSLTVDFDESENLRYVVDLRFTSVYDLRSIEDHCQESDELRRLTYPLILKGWSRLDRAAAQPA